MAKGNISVDSENLFPIIKKWLYSDKDIFLRELVSNGCDAVTKLKKLASIGEAQIDENEKFKVTVSIFKDAKKLVISDNGIGMTAEEIDKYINQIAFSGASDFLSKYKEEDDKGSQIIGHFGLGFYSAFMVADSVEIDSLSYQDGAKAAKWTCDGSMEFDLTDGDRTERGTTITLNIAEDSEEFLEESTIRQILHKYCAFLPIEIYVEVPEDKHEDHCDCGHDHDHDHEEHEHHHEHDENCTCGCHDHDHEHHHDHDHEEHEHHHEHDENCTCGCHDHHHGHEGHHHADEVFTSWGKETAHKYTEEELDYLLKALSETDAYGTVLRSKGIIQMADGSWKQFDMVPEEYEVREGQADYTGRVCVIGTDLKEEDLIKLFHI